MSGMKIDLKTAYSVALEMVDVLEKQTRLLFPQRMSENELHGYFEFKLATCGILSSAIIGMILHYTTMTEIQLISQHLDNISNALAEKRKRDHHV